MDTMTSDPQTISKAARNWNELQDEGPLEVRVKRLTAAPGQHCADAKAAIQSACASVTKPCCRC